MIRRDIALLVDAVQQEGAAAAAVAAAAQRQQQQQQQQQQPQRNGNGHGQRAPPVDAEAAEHVRRALMAAAYTQHGMDLGALFGRDHDLGMDGADAAMSAMPLLWSAAELHPHLQRLLPGVLSRAELRALFAALDTDADGRATLGEVLAFVRDGRKRSAT